MKLIRENLDGQHVALELITEEHREALRPEVNHQDIWTYATLSGYGDGFDVWFDDAKKHNDEGRDFTYIVRDKASNRLVGSTRYTSIFADHNRLEIGYTWYIPEFWGGVVNPNCKLLLFNLAFERMGANRVELKANNDNKRSLAAMKKAGAVFEGVMRHHMVNADGTLRDSAIFSIIKPDWPQAKAGLLARLS